MSEALKLLLAVYAGGFAVMLTCWVIVDWWQQRKHDHEDREWRRQWHEDYRKQQERGK